MSTATQRLLDHLLDGDLRGFIHSRRINGRSWRSISLELHDDFQVDVTHETLRNWYADYETRQAS